MANQLSTKQKRMAELMLEEHTAVYSYKEAGYKGNPDDCAHKIADNSRFKAYLAELQQESKTNAVATRADILENATGIMHETRKGKPSISLAAGEQLAKLTGEFAPERSKVEVTLTPLEEAFQNVRSTGTIKGDENE